MSEITTVRTHQALTRNIARNYVSKEPVLSDQYLLICAGAFSGQNKIATITFPKHLVSIKNKGFYSCQYLSEVRLPHSVSELGTEAFGECHRLRKVYISNSLEHIPNYCFRRDKKLHTVLFTPKSMLTSIDTEAFCECSSLNSILLPPMVKEIGDRAFYRCKSMKLVRFPEGLKRIGENAFYFCGIESLVLPQSLEELGDSAFFKCTSLLHVELPTGIRKLGKWVFHGCSRLKTLTIRHDPEEIGPWICNRATTIRCYEGSKMDNYCKEYEFPVEYLVD